MSSSPTRIITYRDLIRGLRQLDLPRPAAVIAHASLSAFVQVNGGASSLLGALLACVDSLVMPAFTFRTELIPEVGPKNNGIIYGSGRDTNRMAEFYSPQMPVDPLVGRVAETLRQMPASKRSIHPILSFTGINAAAALQAQSIQDPLAPIGFLAEQNGWVLLLGVDHTVNTSIHYGEKLAGRKQFVRWSLTPDGVKECSAYPGCSDGFQAISPRLDKIARRVFIGEAMVQAIALVELFDIVRTMLEEDPLALLCGRDDCPRCISTRILVEGKQ